MARRSRWFGMGHRRRGRELSRRSSLLREQLGERREPVELAQVQLPAPALSEGISDRLRRVAQVRTDHEARVIHAAGKGYLDLVRLRAGEPLDAPDAVVTPGDLAAVQAVTDLCGDERVAIVPFGGGTSVLAA